MGPEAEAKRADARASLVNRYILCVATATIANIEPGSEIRKVKPSGVRLLKPKIRVNGWTTGSFLYVVEDNVDGVTPITQVIDSYTAGSVKDGYKVGQFLGTQHMQLIQEPTEATARRRFRLVDGAHRLAAVRELIAEYEEAGDADSLCKAGTLKVLPVMVFREMPKKIMIQLASVANEANTDYVPTTYLDRLTCIKRAYDEWLGRITVENELLANAGKKKEIMKPNAPNFLKVMEQELAESGQTLEGTFGGGARNLEVELGLANSLHQGTMDYMMELFENDVSIFV